MTYRRNLLIWSFLLTFGLWALNFVALQLSLYWSLDWYDYLMHFLGGLTLGVFMAWLFRIEERSADKLLKLFTLVMVLGVVWELFEYVSGITFSTQNYGMDTVQDIIMDALGALVAYYLVTLQKRQ